MKRILNVSLLITISVATFIVCNQQTEKTSIDHDDRFADKFIDITEIADVRRLTELKRDFAPFFSPSGKRIYFSRLIINSSADVDSDLVNNIENYFSIDYKTNQLYILQEIPAYPRITPLPPDSLPSLLTESPGFGVRTKDAIYFSMHDNNNPYSRNVYKAVGDSIAQITYGSKASYLQVISPDGRYIVFLYDQNHSSIVVYDSLTGNYYIVPKSNTESSRYDLMPMFSPDSKYLVFLRSGDLYNTAYIPFGDIWLVEFKDD
jgi:Tol biopolymer transport system component